MSGVTDTSAGTVETSNLEFVANQPILVQADTLNNSTKYLYTHDFIVVKDSVTTVGLFSTKSDAISFLSENGLNDCSRYFPE